MKMGLDVPNFLTFRNIINYQKIDFFLGGGEFHSDSWRS